MTSLEGQPFPTKDEMEASWRHYLATTKPIIDLLTVDYGLSTGEAILAMEMNGVTNMLQELIDIAQNPQLPGDDWRDDE